MLKTASISGNFTLGIYAEDCLFEDPTIKFRGTQQNNTRVIPRSMHIICQEGFSFGDAN